MLTLVTYKSISRYLCEEDHDCVIIHEVFDGQAPLEKGERELDKAMLARHSTIVIEPHQLGLFSYCHRATSARFVIEPHQLGMFYFLLCCMLPVSTQHHCHRATSARFVIEPHQLGLS